jgi:cytochrome oxidase Cu insertion factor (SCO1/SenC/PrrC family)
MEPTEQKKEDQYRPEDEGADVAIFTKVIAVAVIITIAVLCAAFVKSQQRKAEAARVRTVAPFALTDRSGRPVTQAELEGKFAIVSFVFTSCSVSCLNVSKHMAEIQRLTKDLPDVQLLSLTVDPRSDTPEVLTKFADSFEADANRWLFLTGEKEPLYTLIETSFLKRGTEAENPLMPGGFQGTERIALVDKQGVVRTYFNGMNPDSPTLVVQALEVLRKEGK